MQYQAQFYSNGLESSIFTILFQGFNFEINQQIYTLVCFKIIFYTQSVRAVSVSCSWHFFLIKVINCQNKCILQYKEKLMEESYILNITYSSAQSLADLPQMTNPSFFPVSLLLEIVFLLLFASIFVLTIVKTVKNVYNPLLAKRKKLGKKERSQKSQKSTQKDEQLIKKFEEEDESAEKVVQQSQDRKKIEVEHEKQEKIDQLSYRILQCQSQLLLLHPFLVGNIVGNLMASTSTASIALMVSTIIIYMLFNVKGLCSNVKWLSILYLIPALTSFGPILISLM